MYTSFLALQETEPLAAAPLTGGGQQYTSNSLPEDV